MLYVAWQNIAEFWNVSTRPSSARGGYGISPAIIEGRTRFIERTFRVLTESTRSYTRWRCLIAKHELIGVAVHDARLVAIMLEHRLSRILTFNLADFARYESEGIQILTPATIA